MDITVASLDDGDKILQLQKLAYASEAELYQDWSLPPLTQTLASLAQEFSTSTILKAVINNNIVGSVRARYTDKTCHIGRLIVHPNFQKQGIGSALLQKIEQAFAQAKTYELFTGSKSESNIRFYLSQGYSISHTKTISDRLALTYLTKIRCNLN